MKEREVCVCPDCGARHTKKRRREPTPDRTTAFDLEIFRRYTETDVSVPTLAKETGLSEGALRVLIGRLKRRHPDVRIPLKPKRPMRRLTAELVAPFPVGAKVRRLWRYEVKPSDETYEVVAHSACHIAIREIGTSEVRRVQPEELSLG